MEILAAEMTGDELAWLLLAGTAVEQALAREELWKRAAEADGAREWN